MTLERALGHGFYVCFQNARIMRVYVVASGFGMLFYRGAGIPIRSRFVFRPPILPTSFTLCVTGTFRLQLTFYTIPFNCSFVGRSSDFLEDIPNVLSGLKAVLTFSQLKIPLIRSGTPLTCGTLITPANRRAKNGWTDPNATDYHYFLCRCCSQRSPNQIQWI